MGEGLRGLGNVSSIQFCSLFAAFKTDYKAASIEMVDIYQVTIINVFN